MSLTYSSLLGTSNVLADSVNVADLYIDSLTPNSLTYSNATNYIASVTVSDTNSNLQFNDGTLSFIASPIFTNTNITGNLFTNTLNVSTNGIVINSYTYTFPNINDNVVTRTSTDTLTNKTLTSPNINTMVGVGGTLNNCVIGGTTSAIGKFTEIFDSDLTSVLVYANVNNRLLGATVSDSNSNLTYSTGTLSFVASPTFTNIYDNGVTSSIIWSNASNKLSAVTVSDSNSNLSFSAGTLSFIASPTFTKIYDNSITSKIVWSNASNLLSAVTVSDPNDNLTFSAGTLSFVIDPEFASLVVDGPTACEVIYPQVTNTFNLGTSSNIWSNTYTENLYLYGVTSSMIWSNASNLISAVTVSDSNSNLTFSAGTLSFVTSPTFTGLTVNSSISQSLTINNTTGDNTQIFFQNNGSTTAQFGHYSSVGLFAYDTSTAQYLWYGTYTNGLTINSSSSIPLTLDSHFSGKNVLQFNQNGSAQCAFGYNTSDGSYYSFCYDNVNSQYLWYGSYTSGLTFNTNITTNGTSIFKDCVAISGYSGLSTDVSGAIYIAGGYTSPTAGRLYFGDGTGWNMYFSQMNSSTTTDLFTFQDNGNLTMLTSATLAVNTIIPTSGNMSIGLGGGLITLNSPISVTGTITNTTGTITLGTGSSASRIYGNSTNDLYICADNNGGGILTGFNNTNYPPFTCYSYETPIFTVNNNSTGTGTITTVNNTLDYYGSTAGASYFKTSVTIGTVLLNTTASYLYVNGALNATNVISANYGLYSLGDLGAGLSGAVGLTNVTATGHTTLVGQIKIWVGSNAYYIPYYS